MESPFVFGKIAKGKSFINRKSELKHLTGNFSSGINTMIISPRRWGKSSLVFKAAERVSRNNKNIKFCHLDLFRIQDQNHFLESFAHEILKASSNRWQEWVSTAKELLKGIVSSVSIGADPTQEFSLKLSWDSLNKDEKTILDLPEKISRRKKIKFVICIDEFQKISAFDKGLFLQQKLRSYWQDQSNTSYCLYGSKRHVITELFASQSHPFYRFGDLIFLQKIEPKHWYGYLEKQFAASGKSISREIIDRILDVTSNHPYHIQQLTHHLWRLTEKEAGHDIFETSLEELLLNNEILYRKEIENLTPLQLRYLAAMVNKEPHLNSIETIKKYKLGSPGNLSTIKNALETKEIIDFYESEPTFINPLFEYWVKNVLRLNSH
jgi:hypothetical protein